LLCQDSKASGVREEIRACLETGWEDSGCR
jgi:hypothetical protein